MTPVSASSTIHAFQNVPSVANTLISAQAISILKIVGIVALVLLICVAIGYLIYWIINRNSSAPNTPPTTSNDSNISTNLLPPDSKKIEETTKKIQPNIESSTFTLALPENPQPLDIDFIKTSNLDLQHQTLNCQLEWLQKYTELIKTRLYPTGNEDEYIDLIYNPKEQCLQKEGKILNDRIIFLSSNCARKVYGKASQEIKVSLSKSNDSFFVNEAPEKRVQIASSIHPAEHIEKKEIELVEQTYPLAQLKELLKSKIPVKAKIELNDGQFVYIIHNPNHNSITINQCQPITDPMIIIYSGNTLQPIQIERTNLKLESSNTKIRLKTKQELNTFTIKID